MQSFSAQRKVFHGSLIMNVTMGKHCFYHDILQSMNSGILCVRRQGDISFLNDKAKKILHLSPGNFEGHPYKAALRDYPKLIRLLDQIYTMKTLPNRAEIELGPEKDNALIIGLTVSLIKRDDHEIEGAAIFFKDLTRIEQMAEQEKLKDRLLALGQMAVGFAHEIRNPLASIEFTASRLKRKLKDFPEEISLLDKVLSETYRLNSTINHTLDFVKPLKPEFKMGSINQVLEQTIALALKDLGSSRINFKHHFRSDIPAFLMDEGQMTQVFLNLIVNACEAIGDSEGTVSVSTDLLRELSSKSDISVSEQESHMHHVLVKISDTGRGIPKEARDRIFYPFFTTKESGSGLGLAIAQKIVDSHDGQIDMDSFAGKGTTFRVKLPICLQPSDRAGE